MSVSPKTEGDLIEIVEIPIGVLAVEGELRVPSKARGIVLIPVGSGFSLYGPHIQEIARELYEDGFATLTLDLLTGEEKTRDAQTNEYRNDIELLSHRLVTATDFVVNKGQTQRLSVGYLSTHSGSAAALRASQVQNDKVKAIVSWSGVPDRAASYLRLKTPMLSIVGGKDTSLKDLTEKAIASVGTTSRLFVVPDASHHFDELGAVSAVSKHVRDWFHDHLRR